MAPRCPKGRCRSTSPSSTKRPSTAICWSAASPICATTFRIGATSTWTSTFRIKASPPDLQEVTYVIALGERHKVVKVDISGNRYFTAAQLRERMFLQPAGTIRLRHGRYSQGFAKRDEESLVALYRDNGFRDCKVTAQERRRLSGKAGQRRRDYGNRRGPAIHRRHDGRPGPQSPEPRGPSWPASLPFPDNRSAKPTSGSTATSFSRLTSPPAIPT